MGGGAIGQVLGGLSDLDNAALQGLYALMRQPPPIDPGPEKLAQASQVRTLMLQAQGLLLEYTPQRAHLSSPARPTPPGRLIKRAPTHCITGADDRGQFLDPALHQDGPASPCSGCWAGKRRRRAGTGQPACW